MSKCCSGASTDRDFPKRHHCPMNGKTYASVPSSTIKYHIKAPWHWKEKAQPYYFCDDPECDVVYFGLDNSVIKKAALRTLVGVKEKTDHSLVCYCFGITRKEARDNSEARAFVMSETEKQTCACSVQNPSGRCCLKDFPRS